MNTFSTSVWDAYRSAFRADAHQLIAWGYADARALLSPDCEETQITGYIVQAINSRLDDPGTDKRFEHYYVTEDQPIPGEGRVGKRRRRADIRVHTTSRPAGPRPRYVLEAKRLRRNSHTMSTYLSSDGLLRFIEDTSYAEDATEAAMLGYVQSPTVADWATELQKRVSEATDELRIRQPLRTFDSAGLFTHCFVGGHERFDGRAIDIRHILLDCT